MAKQEFDNERCWGNAKKMSELTALGKKLEESTRTTFSGIKEQICMAAHYGNESIAYYDYDSLDLNEIAYIVFYLRYQGYKVNYEIKLAPDEIDMRNYVKYRISWNNIDKG